jgi:hypothetical protein
VVFHLSNLCGGGAIPQILTIEPSGNRFLSATMVHTPLNERKLKRLWILTIGGLVTLILAYGLTALVIELGVEGRNPDHSREKQFDDFDDPYRDIIVNTLPFAQQWYRSLNLGDDLLPSTMLQTPNGAGADVETEEAAGCLDSWSEDLTKYLPETTPYMIELVLEHMSLRNHRKIREYLTDFLDSPQSLVETYNTTRNCLMNIPVMVDIICNIQEKVPRNLDDNDQYIHLSYAVHIGVVLEVLTNALPNDVATLGEVVQLMQNEQRIKRDTFVRSIYSGRDATFMNDKYTGIAQAFGNYARMIIQNDWFDSGPALTINILEAVVTDADDGYTSNARVGMALAASPKPDSVIEDHKMFRRFGKLWADAYMGWNFVFVVGNFPYYFLPKLLIPAVTCKVTKEDQAENWISPRLVSLSLLLMVVPSPPSEDLQDLIPQNLAQGLARVLDSEHSPTLKTGRYPVATELGKINLEAGLLSSPTRNTVERMLFTLCGGFCYEDIAWGTTDTAPFDLLDDEQFRILLGFTLTATTMIAGLGLEFLVWVRFLHTWNETHEFWFRVAQFFFPLLLVTVLGLALTHNYMAMPLCAVSLWKFGFPETIHYSYLGLFGRNAKLVRASDLLNGMGTLIHHSASVFIVCMLLAGVLPYSRYIISPCIVIAAQHICVTLKYNAEYVYLAVELLLEVLFEWIVISEFWYYSRIHWTAALGSGVMLIGHWFFLLASTLLLFSGHSENTSLLARGNEAILRRSVFSKNESQVDESEADELEEFLPGELNEEMQFRSSRVRDSHVRWSLPKSEQAHKSSNGVHHHHEESSVFEVIEESKELETKEK